MMEYVSEPDAAGWRLLRCSVCSHEVRSPFPPERVHHQCPGKKPGHGPGTHLEAILKQLQIRTDGPGCKCLEMKVQMDYWGPAGCRQNRKQIIAHLQERYDEASIPTKLTALHRALTQGLPKTLDGLLDEAIRRAEE